MVSHCDSASPRVDPGNLRPIQTPHAKHSKARISRGSGRSPGLNHGPYSMKGVEEPLEICEVGEEGKARLRQPPDSEKAHRFTSADSESVLGRRPAIDQAVPGTGWNR